MKISFLLTPFLTVLLLSTGCRQKENIDRFALVNRHNVHITVIDSLNTLTVGNGQFAFSADITGLQTFPEYYSKGIPLGTMADWGWHSFPDTMGYSLSDAYKTYDLHGREVTYVHRYSDKKDPVRTGASDFLRENPHRIQLAVVGLEIAGPDGVTAKLKDIVDPDQELNMWTGELNSTFNVFGSEVNVKTVCDPSSDMISVRVNSPLVANGMLRVKISLPLGGSSKSGFGFNNPARHKVSRLDGNDKSVVLRREMDSSSYYIHLSGNQSEIRNENDKVWYLEPSKGDSLLEFSCRFSPDNTTGELPGFSKTESASASFWPSFWNSGGAVDFSGCTDPRAAELERRVVLSRYLTRIQCAGPNPPAETGLTYNSWYGKFHLEMHWWHAVHFALWQKEDILARQMDYYSRISGKARAMAALQGYEGVRWPKMTDPAGNESPSGVGPYLIWQQPHFIYFAELLYQNSTDKKAVVDKYGKLVLATSDFMASYAWRNPSTGKYQLGPILIPAQESLKLETTVNPVFELNYWYWALETAGEWKKRMGLGPDSRYRNIIDSLSPLPHANGVYLCSEDTRDSWENKKYMSDHPIIAGIKGMLPSTPLVDDKILAASLDTILKKWNWPTCWGWDYPMLAMSAASIGRASQAVDFLMMESPKNRYLPNGHNYQDQRLTLYLPGNGGLLSAVAMMCTGDLFPHDGKWKVKWENLNSLK
ncbi:MAG: hypothetical protein U0X39_08590 [Bacteroidales bacterium]